jgi:RNA polymerase sigma-70 factor (ECF subfamily)
LLSRLKNWDDSQSWKDFFNSYWQLIYGVAIKTGLSDVEAQDVVQETIITVANKIGEFRYDPTRSFKGWLLNTARWKINDQFRKRIPRQDHAPREDDATGTSTIGRLPDPGSLDLGALWDQEWKSHIQDIALERIKQKVNPKHYQIFDYYVLRQWPVEKVTSALRISEHQVYQGKTRILRQLKAEISRLEAKNI